MASETLAAIQARLIELVAEFDRLNHEQQGYSGIIDLATRRTKEIEEVWLPTLEDGDRDPPGSLGNELDRALAEEAEFHVRAYVSAVRPWIACRKKLLAMKAEIEALQVRVRSLHEPPTSGTEIAAKERLQ